MARGMQMALGLVAALAALAPIAAADRTIAQSTNGHPAGEWRGAAIELNTPLLAQYAVAHYLEQPRVLDADVEP